MQQVVVNEAFIQGALSARRSGDALYPCRLPYQRRHLFFSDHLLDRAFCASGVRLRLETDAEIIALSFAPLPPPGTVINGHAFDAVVDNEIVQVVPCGKNATEAVFDKIGNGLRTIELWLPPSCPVGLKKIKARKASVLRPLPDRRPMWVTWGSSITHCVRAGSAARIWPATVARRHNLNLVNLGFGGACLLEPTVAMVIRDLPARFISMKLGINAVGNSLSARTYPALVAAAVAIIREKHPHAPLALISPIASPPRESTPSKTGYTLEGMRADMEAVHRALVSEGDMHLYYVSGLDLFGMRDINRYSADKLHPDADGIDLQAERFSRLVMPLLLGK
jgi:hypothetical protein